MQRRLLGAIRGLDWGKKSRGTVGPGFRLGLGLGLRFSAPVPVPAPVSGCDSPCWDCCATSRYSLRSLAFGVGFGFGLRPAYGSGFASVVKAHTCLASPYPCCL